MNDQLLYKLIRIAELYYIDELTQQQIADRVHIHRTEISRMLKQAKKLGIVQVSINRNIKSLDSLQSFFINQFKLKDILIVHENVDENSLQTLGDYGAMYLEKQIANNSIIGLSWGRTLAHVVSSLKPNSNKHGITVVPLIGGAIGQLKNDYQSGRLTSLLSEKLNARCESLNSPALVKSINTKKELLSNHNNMLVTNYWERLDVAVVGIGSDLITNLNQWQQFYKDTNFEDIFKKTNAVGDILSHPYNKYGQFINVPQLIVMGIEPTLLKKVPTVIGIACGKNKVASILGALNTGILDVLITTDIAALAIKDLYSSNSQM